MTDEQPGGPRPIAAPPDRPADGRMTRSRRHKVVGGVCGGLGRHFDLDPVIFRVPLAVLSVIGGAGFIAYGVAWLVMPFEGEEENEGRRMLSGRVEGPGLTALLFVVVGCGLLLAAAPGSGGFFSVMLLGTLIGAAYWSRHRRQAADSGLEGAGPDPVMAQAAASAPPEVQAPPAPGGMPWWQTPGGTPHEEYLWGPSGSQAAALPRRVELRKDPEERDPWQVPGQRPPEPYRRFWLGGLVLLGALASGALATLLSWSSQPLGTVGVYAGAAMLAVFAVGLAVSAFAGRLGAGTLVCVVLTGALLIGASALPKDIPTEWTDHRWSPAAVSEVEPRYELGTGLGELDLSELELEEGERLEVEVDAGAGRFQVVVPHDAMLELTSDVWLGAYEYSDREQPNVGLTAARGGFRDAWSDSYGPRPGTETRGTVALSLSMGLGYLSIERAAAPPDEEDAEDAEGEEAEEGEEAAAGPLAGGTAREAALAGGARAERPEGAASHG